MASTDLVSTGQPVGQLLQAPHHPLIPEVIRKCFRPLSQQLHQLWRHLTETNLKKKKEEVNVKFSYCVNVVE